MLAVLVQISKRSTRGLGRPKERLRFSSNVPEAQFIAAYSH